MGIFDDLFGGGQKAAETAGQLKTQALEKGYNVASDFYGQGRNALTQGYGQAQDIFQPVYSTGLQGAQTYADVTGAAGPEGQARAAALFQTDPGYQFALDQQQQAIARQSGTGAGQFSGGLLDALQKNAAGYASQQYGNWVNRLQPFLNYNILGANQLGGAYTGQANALNTSLGQQGTLGFNTQAGIGNAQAQAVTDAAAAKSAEIGQASKLASSLLGYAVGGPLGGAVGGGLGSLFGGGTPTSSYGVSQAGAGMPTLYGGQYVPTAGLNF